MMKETATHFYFRLLLGIGVVMFIIMLIRYLLTGTT